MVPYIARKNKQTTKQKTNFVFVLNYLEIVSLKYPDWSNVATKVHTGGSQATQNQKYQENVGTMSLTWRTAKM